MTDFDLNVSSTYHGYIDTAGVTQLITPSDTLSDESERAASKTHLGRGSKPSNTPIGDQSLSLLGSLALPFYQDLPLPGLPTPVDEARAAAPDLGRWRNRRGPIEVVVDGMQKWDGVVCSVNDSTFTVDLMPSDHEGPSVYADFDLTLLTPSEQESLAPGNVVYVTVRTIRNRSRQSTRTSAIRVARLGRWTVSDIAKAKARAKTQVVEMLANIE